MLKRRTLIAATAIAACFAALPAAPEVATNGRWLLQLTPPTDFTPSDGREMDVPAWRINAQIARKVIESFNPAQPLVIDYEHQTLTKDETGQLAPAAGWIHGIRWIEGRGLFAEAELTARAKALIDAREYLYFSPVFVYSKTTGAIERVLMGALTNYPAVHGMQALDNMVAAAARLFQPDPSETTVNPLLKQLLAAIGLPDTTTEDAAIAACSALKAQVDAARTGLKLQGDATAESVIAACTSLQAAAAGATPDPSKFVPISTMDQLKTDLAVLTARQLERDVNDLITPALADGRLLPAQEAWARDLGKTNVAALSGYLKTAQPVAALTGTQTQGKPPAGDAKADANFGLTADELAVAAACGIAPKDYAAAKA